VNDAPDWSDFVVDADRDDALAGQQWGDPDGHPVILLHGMPGSRLGPRPRGIVLERMGIHLISYDRPGYGGSKRRPGRKVVDAAEDVRRVADHLGLKRFAVVGRSGGGPHALACAAELGYRVERVALLVSSAPPDAPGLNWDDGMASVNVKDFADVDRGMADARAGAVAEAAALRTRAKEIEQDPRALIRYLLPELAAPDKRVVGDPAMRNLLTDTYAEAVRQGPDGWIDDAVALRKPWDFKFDEVECPVLLWHGRDDRFSPVAHAKWMARELRRSRASEQKKAEVQLRIELGAAHFAAFEIFTEVLGWLVDPDVTAAPSLARTAVGRAIDGFVFRTAEPPHSDVLGQSTLPVG
jgi:pimeloyl-ACP methyl ester carboxylesterase